MFTQQQTLDFFQQHLGYDDKEMKLFKDDPRNLKVLSRAPALMEKPLLLKSLNPMVVTAITKQVTNFILMVQET